jgi:DNA-binding LacI/PurR family transcriptional regulator
MGDHGKRRGGRPRIHTTGADRQRAYRERLRARGLRMRALVLPADVSAADVHAAIAAMTAARRGGK